MAVNVPRIKRISRALVAQPQSIQQQLADAQRQEQIAQALIAESQEGPPSEWNRMRIVPKYTAGHGLTKIGQAIAGAYGQQKADSKREKIARELQGKGQEIGRAAGLGGENPANIAAAEFNRENPGELEMVETTAQMKPWQADTARIMQLATTPEGQMALQQNPVLAQFVAQQLAPPEAARQPASVQEYEYARRNGFKGTFQDWIAAGGQTSRPSSVQEWDFYQSLSPDKQKLYLEMKRNPNMQVRDIGGVPTVVAPSVSGTQTTALSTLPQEAAATGTLKQAESRGGAIGKAEGEIVGGIQTKGASAQGVLGLLDVADPLIDVATGSSTGAAVDALAKAFGKAPDGAQAIASLKVLQASLIQNMPRLEGPQSDADRALYVEAAGQIGEPTVPRPIKKAALGTIRQIQEKYRARAAGDPVSERPTGPRSREDILKQYGL